MNPSTNLFTGVGVCRKRIIEETPKEMLETLIIKQGCATPQPPGPIGPPYPKMLYLKRK